MNITFSTADWRLWALMGGSAILAIIAFFSEGKSLTMANIFATYRKVKAEIDGPPLPQQRSMPASFYHQTPSIRPPTFIGVQQAEAAVCYRDRCRSKAEALAMEVFHDIIASYGGDPHLIKVGARLPFMKNPKTGRRLELDGWYEPWKVALEYNGVQHYEYPNLYHPETPKGEKDFKDGRQRDIDKNRIAAEHGIHIINVPYYIDKGKSELERKQKLHEFIHKEMATILK